MVDAPLISVVIPTYNRSSLLPRAIESVINQTYDNLDIIIVDDASTDGTEKIINDYEDPRIRYHRHDENKGGAAARNTGISKSKGDYIAFLDSDDAWLPSKITLQKRAYDNYGGEVVIYSDCYKSRNNSRFLTNSPTDIRSGDLFYDFLSGWNEAITSGLYMPKKFLTNQGTFDKTLPKFQEHDLNLRLSQRYDYLGLNIPLFIKYSGHISLSSHPKHRKEGLELFFQKWGETIRSELGDKTAESFYRDRYEEAIYVETLSELRFGSKVKGMSNAYDYLNIATEYQLTRWVLIAATLFGGDTLYRKLTRFKQIHDNL